MKYNVRGSLSRARRHEILSSTVVTARRIILYQYLVQMRFNSPSKKSGSTTVSGETMLRKTWLAAEPAPLLGAPRVLLFTASSLEMTKPRWSNASTKSDSASLLCTSAV
jgi:hypothetical protein